MFSVIGFRFYHFIYSFYLLNEKCVCKQHTLHMVHLTLIKMLETEIYAHIVKINTFTMLALFKKVRKQTFRNLLPFLRNLNNVVMCSMRERGERGREPQGPGTGHLIISWSTSHCCSLLTINSSRMRVGSHSVVRLRLSLRAVSEQGFSKLQREKRPATCHGCTYSHSQPCSLLSMQLF